MSVDIWRGPGGTAAHPKGGEFLDASNWSGGAVPDGSSRAILSGGHYTVNLHGAGVYLGALEVGAGVTLVINEPDDALTAIVMNGDASNSGRVVIAGSLLQVNGGASLFNIGEIYGAGGYYAPSIQGGGTVVNYGLIAGSDGTNPGGLIITTAVQNEADGVVNTRGGGRIAFASTVDNAGLISAIDGGLVTFNSTNGAGNTLNLGEGVLDGGHWSAIGAGSTLNLYNSDIESLTGGAVVTLSGAGSAIGGEDASGLTQIETSLSHIDSGSELHILGGRDYATGQDLDVSGLVELGGGTLTSAGLTVHDDAGSEVRGYGLITSDMDMYGALRADRDKGGLSLELSGANRIFGSLIGKGTLELNGSTTLEVGSQVLCKDIMLTANGALQMNQNLTYDGRLEVAGGSIDMGGHILRLTGTVGLGAGEISSGQLQFEGAQVTSAGLSTIGAGLRNDGVVTIRNGELLQFGAVNGTGEYHIQNHALLGFAAAVGAGQTVFMDGSAAQLEFGAGAVFRGAVSGFAAGDSLIFDDFHASSTTVGWKADGAGGGTLTVTSGAERETVHLDGSYQRGLFHLADNGLGDATVTYGAAAGAEAHWDAHGALVI